MARRLIAILVAAATLLALTTPSHASWTAPAVTLSPGGADAVEPVTGVGPAGHAAFAWRRMDDAGDWRIQLRVRNDAGTLGAVQTVSPAGDSAYSPDVAIDATGRAVVVWSQRDDATGTYRVYARVRSSAGTLGAVRDLSAGVGSGAPLQSSAPQVEIDANGAAVVAWETVFSSASYRAVARTLTAGGAVAPTWQELSGDGVNLRPVSLALDDAGTAFIAWARDDGTNMRIQARTRTAAGVLGPVLTVSPGATNATTPDVAVTPDGNRVVGWVRYDTATDALYARTVSSAGVLGAVKLVSAADKFVEDSVGAPWGEVGISDGGDAVFVWQQSRPCCSHEVMVRGLSAAGTLSTLNIAGPAYSIQPQVAVDPTGQAVLTFTQRDAQGDQRIRVRTRSVAGALSTMGTLSPGLQDSGHSDVAVNHSGLAVATWVRNDGTGGSSCCDRVQYAVGP